MFSEVPFWYLRFLWSFQFILESNNSSACWVCWVCHPAYIDFETPVHQRYIAAWTISNFPDMDGVTYSESHNSGVVVRRRDPNQDLWHPHDILMLRITQDEKTFTHSQWAWIKRGSSYTSQESVLGICTKSRGQNVTREIKGSSLGSTYESMTEKEWTNFWKGPASRYVLVQTGSSSTVQTCK